MLGYYLRAVCTAAVLLVFAPQAQASLIGDEVFACVHVSLTTCANQNFFSPTTAIVDAGSTEFTFVQPGAVELSADLTGDRILLSAAIFNEGGLASLTWEFEDLDWLPTPGSIVGVSDEGGGLALVGLTSGPDSVRIMTGEIPTGANVVVSREFRLVTRHDNPIPEPGSATLFGMGSILVGAALRRR